jgi:hypothetical protein
VLDMMLGGAPADMQGLADVGVGGAVGEQPQDLELARVPADIPGIPVRVIEYSVTSADGSQISETFTLVTDITDPAALSAEQAADAYARRWQLETCFGELETSIRGGAAVVLRSKSPPMIRQEIYAMLCCYQAIRTLISHAADDAGIDPLRVSFTAAREAVRSRISDSGCFSPSAP